MKYYKKLVSTLTFCLLLLGMLPILYLGTYNHPTGDDYHYGVETHHIWDSTHNMIQVIKAACEGVATQYQIWQGTYSAMFLMYLPPNIWGDTAYHLITAVILLLLCGGIFYLLRKVLCGWLKASAAVWVTVSSIVAMLWIQTVDFQSESFFWYNGSMYYTGFFAVTLFFFGLLCSYLQKGGWPRILLLCVLAVFLAGGNYVTFLPATILCVSLSGLLLRYKQNRRLLPLLPVYVCLFAGFAINATAPGNQVRQSGMWQISPILAILKSLRQGIYFLVGMTDLWFVIALVLITPLLWDTYNHVSFQFRYPLLVMGFSYGVMCSAFCPTFYTMNSTGPARAVAVMYYIYVLFIVFCYAYGLGYVRRVWREKFSASGQKSTNINQADAGEAFPNTRRYQICFCILLFGLFAFQTASGAWRECTAARAIRCLASGDAAAYEAEYQERMAILNDPSVQTVVFQPYRVQADLLYIGDLTGDPEHPTNQRVAAYFDKESVMVEWE